MNECLPPDELARLKRQSSPGSGDDSDESESKRRRKPRHLFLNGHPQREQFWVCRRARPFVPVPIGRRIPNPATDQNGYAIRILLLTKPWRVLADLRSADHRTWFNAFEQYRRELDERVAAGAGSSDESRASFEIARNADNFIHRWGALFQGEEAVAAERSARAAARNLQQERESGNAVPGFDMPDELDVPFDFGPDEGEYIVRHASFCPELAFFFLYSRSSA